MLLPLNLLVVEAWPARRDSNPRPSVPKMEPMRFPSSPAVHLRLAVIREMGLALGEP